MQLIEAGQIIGSHEQTPADPAFAQGTAHTQGQYRPIDEGVVPIQDMGFIHADAAYDVVSASAGYLFRMQEHLDRFNASCEKFHLENPYTDEETVEILTNLVKLAGLRDAYIWWAVTRGKMLGERGSMEFENRFYAFVTPYLFIMNDAQRRNGANLIISQDYRRIPPDSVDPTAKNFHWMDMKLSVFEAAGRGGDWSVLTDGEGLLTESPGCNIFLIHDGVVKTPATGCLEGITRQTVLELATDLGLETVVGDVYASELESCDEAFLTSTAGAIMPASHVNGAALAPHAGPGELTTQLHNLYWERRWDGWHGEAIDYSTPVAGFELAHPA
ncbi:MAG: aminotransferase class IV [Acidobacteriota bacterium]